MDRSPKTIVLCRKCRRKNRIPSNIGEIIVTCGHCGEKWGYDTGRKSNVEPGQLGFRYVDLEQGASAWHQWRGRGIGASDAPAIMGENPWKSRKQLLREKLEHIRVPANEKMKRGTRLEPEARRLYTQTTGVDVHPACLEHKKFAWLHASVDGLSQDATTIVEIKCGESVYRHSESKKTVPRYYVGQLQHILAVTDLGEIDFWCYLPNRSPVLLKVKRDRQYITHLLSAEQAFWNELCELRRS